MLVTHVFSLDEFRNFINIDREIDYEHIADMFNKFAESFGKPKDQDNYTAQELMEWHPLLVYQLQQKLLQHQAQSASVVNVWGDDVSEDLCVYLTIKRKQHQANKQENTKKIKN